MSFSEKLFNNTLIKDDGDGRIVVAIVSIAVVLQSVAPIR